MSLTAITTFVVIRKKPKDSKPFGETEFRFQNGKCNPDKLDESQIKVVFPSQNPVENNKEFIYKFLNYRSYYFTQLYWMSILLCTKIS